jgi:Uma2 family endonuclease
MMATAIMLTRPTTTPSPELTSGLYRITVRQYDRMIDDGSIAEDDRVVLIEGLLVNKMGRKRPHIVAGNKGLRMLSGIIPRGWYVAKEDPIVVSDWSKPEPDLAVVRGQAEDYIERDVRAADVALVVEIAESSLAVDRTDMTRVYAASEIPIYWIVNLVDQQLEVYSDPGPISYSSVLILKPGEDVRVIIDGVEIGWIAVADMLP